MGPGRGDEAIERKRRAFADPTRVRILEVVAAGDRTVKQIGRDLGIDPNRLYYHLRILEEAELIEVTGTETSGRMVEKRYGAVGGRYGNELPGPSPEGRVTFFHAILDATKADVTDVVFEQARRAQAGGAPLSLRILKGLVLARPTDLATFVARLEGMIDDLAEASQAGGNGDDLRGYPYTFAIYERPGGS